MEDLQHQFTTAQTDAIYWQQQAKQITQELNERMTQEVQSYLRSMETLRDQNRLLLKQLREAHEEIGHLKANNRYQRGYADGQKEPTAPTPRPSVEAASTPIPKGRFRVFGHQFHGQWIWAENKCCDDTHFADLRLPAPEEGGAA